LGRLPACFRPRRRPPSGKGANPFAETKEQLLGFYIVDCATLDDAIEAAKDLARASGSAGAYELRPVALFRPGGVVE
jgi:hypothetical protein